jgi:hypothetical protein
MWDLRAYELTMTLISGVIGGEAPVTPPPATPVNDGFLAFTDNYHTADIGTFLEWSAVAGNQHGYRVFRATSATGEGISISDFPINPRTGESRIVTFDPNVRPGRTYYYYLREVLEEASFDIAAVVLTPEVLGAPSARKRVQIPAARPGAAIPADDAVRGFIMMWVEDPDMNVNNLWQEIDPGRGTYPVLRNARTMLPIRAVVEAMTDNDPSSVGWNGGERRIDLAAQGNRVSMWIGNLDANVNGATVEMDVAPFIENERTLLPLRFVAQFLDAQIEWIGSERLVVIVYDLP